MLADHFEKTSNAERKPGFQMRRRSRSFPDIIMEQKSPEMATAPSSAISCNDPRKKPE